MLLLLIVVGCDLPRDPDGTLDRIEADRSFRVGLIANGGDARGAAEQAALIDRIARRTAARPVIRHGSAEPLLAELEAGGLDVVIGHFDGASPWSRLVTLTDPIRDYGGHGLVAALPNGENRWIMLVERETRALSR
ncbi:hypothetical protein ABC347_12560 [Sphingomonas sp. 1P06PA]|uniref:hypothetical protein n=1 Tax=Sphingomonas sp. 1P06PA TaxID=554121 RepID=UPI0039A6D3D7